MVIAIKLSGVLVPERIATSSSRQIRLSDPHTMVLLPVGILIVILIVTGRTGRSGVPTSLLTKRLPRMLKDGFWSTTRRMLVQTSWRLPICLRAISISLRVVQSLISISRSRFTTLVVCRWMSSHSTTQLTCLSIVKDMLPSLRTTIPKLNPHIEA